ncbi:hypothetical protein JXB28_05125 [Candidatus Woesearchaeota archaeon]|nr:hypothetical protein [Candidatus Woesearchaeota archaeon]
MGLFSKKHKEPEPSSQPAPASESTDFDSLAPEIPPPPSDFPAETERAQQPSPEAQPAPSPAQQEGSQPALPDDDKKDFELPDFDDSDMMKEEPAAPKKEPEKKPEPPKPAPPPPKPAPPPQPKPPEEPPHRFVDQKETFLYVLDYLNARDAADEVGSLLGETAQSIANHSLSSKIKDDKYAALIKELNLLQEKLMDIDTKLFEEV